MLGRSTKRSDGRRVSNATIVLAGVVVLLTVSTIVTLVTPRDEPVAAASTTFFPTWSGGGASQGQVIGLLSERDGCVFLRSLGRDHLALWPSGTTWNRGTLMAASGEPVGHTADTITGFASSTDSRTEAERLVGPIPDRCVPHGDDPFVQMFDMQAAPELVRSVVVPDVVGLGDTAADAAMREHVLDAVIDTVPSSRAQEGVVIRQDPAAFDFVEMGARVRRVVGIGPTRPVPLPSLPPVGVAVAESRGVRLVGLDGRTIVRLPHYEIVENNLGPVYLRHGDAFYLLDPDARRLTPVAERQAERIYPDPVVRDVAVPPGVPRDVGHWRYVLESPVSEDALGQWSGECETPYAIWIHPDGEPQPVTGEARLRGTPVSFALGWTPDGAAIVHLPDAACGSGSSSPGVYLFDAPGDGRLLVETDGAVRLWTTAERAVP